MPSTEIQFEDAFYIGNYIGGILYGMYLCTYFFSVYFIQKSQMKSHRSTPYTLIYATILVLVTTINAMTNPLFGQWMWINHRNVPGGPPAYFAENISMWVETLGSAAAITANFMGDGLLLYRAYIICGSKRLLIAFPVLLYLGSTAMAILTVIESGLPGADLFKGNPAIFSIAWISLTVGLNIILTTMISARLLSLHKQVKKIMDSDSARMYTGIAAILIESAAPFSVLGITFIVTTVRQIPAQYAMASVWGIFASISPQLIILRVAMGMGWSEDVVSQVSNTAVVFAAHTREETSPDIGEKHPGLLRVSITEHFPDGGPSQETTFV